MGCIVRRTYKARSGRVVRSRRYYVRYIDADGRLRMEVAFTDRRASEARLAERETEAARGIVHLKDPFREHRGRPLADHLAEFLRHLLASGVSKAHVEDVGQVVRRAFAQMGTNHASEVTTSKVEGHLLKLVEEGRAAKTRNHVRDRLCQFFAWGVANGRWATNPVAAVNRLNADADPRRRRRPLTAWELNALVEAARTRPRAMYLKAHPSAPPEKLKELEVLGEERSCLYLTAALTGLRRNELAQLCWGDLSLDAETPTFTVRAETAKSKRTDTLPLASNATAALRAWRESWARAHWRVPGANDPVFTCVRRKTVEHFRADCCFGAIELETPQGRLDFHALRHSTATLLCQAGVPVRTAQSLMRHTDPRTTMRVYAHVQAADRLDAVARLADITTLEPKAKAATAGG